MENEGFFCVQNVVFLLCTLFCRQNYAIIDSHKMGAVP